MSSYPTSRDYDELLRLMQAGHNLVCFVDYRFSTDTLDEPPARDICRTRYEPPVEGRYDGHPFLAVQCRGICYAGGLHFAPGKFIKDCQRVNLEFIPPTLPVS